MSERVSDPLVIALVSEIVVIEQLVRGRLGRALPKGLELSQFMVLNHLSRVDGERTPAQLARTFHVSKGAMTNTVQRLDARGYVHIRPDWDDGRQKWVRLSPAGQAARDAAARAIAPVFDDLIEGLGAGDLRDILPVLRTIRGVLAGDPPPRLPRVAKGPETVGR